MLKSKKDILKTVVKTSVLIGTGVIIDQLIPKDVRQNLPFYKRICVWSAIAVISGVIAKNTEAYINETIHNTKNAVNEME